MIKEICDSSDSKFEVLDEILAQLQKDIAEIKVALLGNEYNPGAGLVYRTIAAERELERLKNKVYRIIWTTAGAASVLTIVLNIIWVLFQKFVLN